MTPEQLNTLTAKLDADPATLDSNRLIELCVLARTLPQAGAAYAAKLAGHLKTRFPAATIAQDVDFAALGKLCAGLGHPVLPADEQKTALESALNTDLATVDFDRLVELGLLYLAVSSILPLWPDTLAAELERRYPAAALEADDSEYSILASLLQQMRLSVSYFAARLDDYIQAADKTAWHAAHQDWFAAAVQQPDNLSWLLDVGNFKTARAFLEAEIWVDVWNGLPNVVATIAQTPWAFDSLWQKTQQAGKGGPIIEALANSSMLYNWIKYETWGEKKSPQEIEKHVKSLLQNSAQAAILLANTAARRIIFDLGDKVVAQSEAAMAAIAANSDALSDALYYPALTEALVKNQVAMQALTQSDDVMDFLTRNVQFLAILLKNRTHLALFDRALTQDQQKQMHSAIKEGGVRLGLFTKSSQTLTLPRSGTQGAYTNTAAVYVPESAYVYDPYALYSGAATDRLVFNASGGGGWRNYTFTEAENAGIAVGGVTVKRDKQSPVNGERITFAIYTAR